MSGSMSYSRGNPAISILVKSPSALSPPLETHFRPLKIRHFCCLSNNRARWVTSVTWIAQIEARATTTRVCVNATRDTTGTTAGYNPYSQSSSEPMAGRPPTTLASCVVPVVTATGATVDEAYRADGTLH